MRPRAPLPRHHIPTYHRLEIRRVIQLLLGAMSVRAINPVWAPVGVRGLAVALVPVRALPRAVPNLRVPPDVEVIVGVDAVLPIVLNTDRAPERLVPIHVEIVRVFALVILIKRKQRPAELFPAVSERALAPALALVSHRVMSAEAPLVHCVRVEDGVGAGCLVPATVSLTLAGLLRTLCLG